MLEVTELPGGGRSIREVSSGKPWTVYTKREPVGNSGVFEPGTQSLDLVAEPARGEAPWARGQVIVTADVSDSVEVPAHDWLYLEVNVIAWISMTQTVIARFALGPGKLEGVAFVDRPYEKITFEARQMAPGTEPPVQAGSLGYAAVGRFWR